MVTSGLWNGWLVRPPKRTNHGSLVYRSEWWEKTKHNFTRPSYTERTAIAKTLLTDTNTKMQKDGVMIIKPEKKKKKTRWTSTYQTTVGSLIEKREKQILEADDLTDDILLETIHNLYETTLIRQKTVFQNSEILKYFRKRRNILFKTVWRHLGSKVRSFSSSLARRTRYPWFPTRISNLDSSDHRTFFNFETVHFKWALAHRTRWRFWTMFTNGFFFAW